MHDAVTTSATPANNLFSSSAEDLLSPISLTTQSQSINATGWSQIHDSVDGSRGRSQETWHIPISNESIAQHPSNNRRSPTKGFPKAVIPSQMPSRPGSSESDSSRMEPSSVHSTGNSANNNRWRFNGSGQLVDSEAASAEWDLADEIVRLKIGGAGGEIVEDVHPPIMTPPKAKMVNGAVVPVNDSSPLETSSDASADSSPHVSDHQISIAHSRGSSTDTTSSAYESVASHGLQAPPQLKVNPGGEAKERPHSFSGGLSAAELRRLQQAGEGLAGGMQSADTGPQHQQWTSTHFRDTIGPNDKQFPPDQPTYPSLVNTAVFPRSQAQQSYEPRSAQSPTSATQPGGVPHSDQVLSDYHQQQRNFSPLSQQAMSGVNGHPQFPPSRPNTSAGNLSYRQPARGFTPQGMVPASHGYPGGHHTPHLSLGTAQQLYDMMHPALHPDSHHPAVARVQQQHNVFPRTHQHSASDPSALRDAATLALLNSNMQAFGAPGPGIYPPTMAPPPPQAMSLYANQFYGTQDTYADLAAAQAMANRLQPQYTGYGSADDGNTGSSGNGPSANNRKLGLYKTELCRSWEEKGTCRYGAKCQFAHGEDELRKVARHPKYKTEICRTFWVSGSCPYGKRCCFIHTELPASGAPPGADVAPPPQIPDGRARSMSTNSDPTEQSTSLLARISAKRKEEGGPNSQNAPTPVDISPPSSGYQFNTRPPTGSLRVDTSVLDSSAAKQNKSAYPTFAGNVMLPANDQASAKSPVPVTAGPDLGRHNNSRLEIVGYNHQQRTNKPTSTNPNVRHSFSGTEVNLDEFNTPVTTQSSFRMASPDRHANGVTTPRVNGHSRSGSAGNWGSFSRGNHVPPSAPYPQSSGASGELKGNSPWSTTELVVGSSRLHEKAWA